MAKNPVGTMFVELDMDTSKYTKSQKEILQSAHQSSLDIETNFRRLGGTSDAMYQAMRQKAENAYQGIANSSKASNDEIIRAKTAMSEKIKQIDEAQHGKSVSLLDKLKGNYLAVSAAAVAGWVAVGKAMEYATLGAKAQQAEDSFRIVSKASGENADKIIRDMKRVSAGTIDDSDIMQKAVKGMALGLKGDQLVAIMEAARVSARVAGEDVKTAYESITDSIATGMPKALKRYGLITKEEMALVNKALKAGVENVDLYSLAMVNSGIQASKMAGDYSKAAESLQRFHAQVEELKETTGKAAISVMQFGLQWLQWFGSLVLGIVDTILWPLSKIPGSFGKSMQAVRDIIGGAAQDLMKDRAKLMGEMTAQEKKAAEDVAKGSAGRLAAAEKEKAALIAKIKAQTDAAEAAKKTANEIESLNKRITEETRKSSAEIAGIGKSIYDKEMERIESQVVAWKKAGANRIAIAKWVANETTLAHNKMNLDILRLEGEAADAIATIRKKIQTRAMDDVKRKIENEVKENEATIKGRAEYQKIVQDALDYSVNAHEKAINHIATKEANSAKTVRDLYDKKQITISEYYSALSAFRDEADAATQEQVTRELSSAADYYSSIAGYEQTAFDLKIQLIERERLANIALYGDKEAAGKKAAQAIMKATSDVFYKQNSDSEHSASSMAANFRTMGGLFKENSRERQAMHNLEMAATIAEMAIQAQKNLMIAVGAVAQQGSGDPYSAFARIAAMIAVMTSVLGMAGIAFGGGGAGGSAPAPVLPASTGLGMAAGESSDSAAKSWKILDETYSMEYRELSGIHEVMKELNQNITGLVTSIVRTGGVGNIATGLGSTPGLAEKATKEFYSFILNPIGLPVLDKIAGYIGKVWGGIYGSMFGGKTTISQTSGGIQFGGSSVGDLLSGGGMDARQYADITKTKKGGWFSSDKTSSWTEYASLDAQVSDMLDSVFRNLGATLVELAKGLGTDTQKAMDYVFGETKLNLQGMDTDAINKAISGFIATTADNAVEALFGKMLRGYQQLNEGLLETAVRLLKDKAVIMDALAMTNQSFVGGTSAAIAFSESIIAIAGDLDTFTKVAGTYYDKFFTDAEKQARLQSQLSGAMADIGLALPASRAGYRALVEGLDLTTDAGKQAYVALIQWSESADKYYTTMGAVIGKQDQLTASLKKQAETITQWLADMNKSTLAPVTSAAVYSLEYARMKNSAFGSGATEADTSAFLKEATAYLTFARSYSGDYANIYKSVTGDVTALAASIANQLTSPSLPAHASGGLTRGVSIAGERGPEWVVPTYEPQRSKFLQSAPAAFWDNMGGNNSGGGEVTVHSHIYLDGKVVAENVAKQIPRNANLSEAIRRVG